MKIRIAFPAAPLAALTALGALAALSLAACGGGHGGPTAPPEPDTFSLSTTLSDADGVPHIAEAQGTIDGRLLGDSCPPGDETPIYDSDGNVLQTVCDGPTISSYMISSSGSIGPGTHSLRFYLVEEVGSGVYPFNVAAFNVVIHDGNGKVIKTISLPSQTVALPEGKAISYTFSY